MKEALQQIIEKLKTAVDHLNLAIISYENDEQVLYCEEDIEDTSFVQPLIDNLSCTQAEYSLIRNLEFATQAFDMSCVNRLQIADALVVLWNPENDVDHKDYLEINNEKTKQLQKTFNLLRLMGVSHVVFDVQSSPHQLAAFGPYSLQPASDIESTTSAIAYYFLNSLPVCKGTI